VLFTFLARSATTGVAGSNAPCWGCTGDGISCRLLVPADVMRCPADFAQRTCIDHRQVTLQLCNDADMLSLFSCCELQGTCEFSLFSCRSAMAPQSPCDVNRQLLRRHICVHFAANCSMCWPAAACAGQLQHEALWSAAAQTHMRTLCSQLQHVLASCSMCWSAAACLLMYCI
jgi:hypothetical protein